MTSPVLEHPNHQWAIDAGADCTNCPLYGCHRGPVRPKPASTGPAKLFIVGEAPGGTEVEEKQPFVGKSGEELDAGLQQGKLRRSETWITNTMLCQPEGDLGLFLEECQRRGWKSPIDACRGRLKREFEGHFQGPDQKVILAVGGRALRWFCEYFGVPYGKGDDDQAVVKSNTILRQHGAPIELTRRGRDWILCSTLHPAFAMRAARQYKYVIRRDIGIAAKIVNRGNQIETLPFTRHVYVTQEWLSKPERERLEHMRKVLVRMLEPDVPAVTCDIETDSKWTHLANIRCVGFGAEIQGEEVVIVLPLLWRDGREYWANFEHRRELEVLIRRMFVEKKIIIYHNGAYDTSVLLRHRLMPGVHPREPWDAESYAQRMKPYFDTMLADHCTDHCDLPHSLGDVTRRNFEVRMWKDDADVKDASGVKNDASLHFYNAEDVVWTMRLAKKLKDRIVRLDNAKPFRVDTQLAPIYREMGQLGLWINERVRADLSMKLRGIMEKKLKAFQEASGKVGINPNSPTQIGTWLYEDLGLRPPIDTAGKEFVDGAAPSTSVPALLRLLDMGVDPKTEQAINALVHWRAAEKIRSTYVENLPVHYAEDFVGTLGYMPAHVVDGKEVLPRRPFLTHLMITWKLHVTPSGRTSSSPNCFDAETEVFTRRGWVKLPDLQEGEEVMQYDPEQRTLKFVWPLRRTHRQYTGKMVYIQSGAIDLRVTADHRLYTETRVGAGRTTLAGEALPTSRYWLHAGYYSQGREVLSRDQIVVLLALQAYGQWEGSRITIALRKSREARILTECMTRLNIPYASYVESTWCPKTQKLRRRRTKFDLFDVDVAFCHPYLSGNVFTWNILNLSIETLATLRDASCYWTGYDHPRMYTSKERQNIEVMSTVYTLTGYRPLIRSRASGWEIEGAWAGSSSTRHARRLEQDVVDEPVYCLTVPSDLVLVRRSGKSQICHQCQNWVSRGYNGFNVKEMVVAPPGHVIVGADLEQVEGRGYAVMAQDRVFLDALAKDMDIHSLNAAMIFTGETIDSPVVMREYHRIRALPDKERKYFRDIAKTVCLTEGTRVLTNRGLVPIEAVDLSDKLWDGVEWVSHDGVVYNGVQDVINYAGLSATPDHVVWCADGKPRTLRDASRGGYDLARSGAGGVPLRFVGDPNPSLERPGTPQSLGAGQARVYDILNAGPRRRFTAADRLVSNCYGETYGAEGGKLFDIFKTARDRVTLTRLFPKVTEADAERWHQAWHKSHPETKRWQNQCDRFQRQYGYMDSLLHDRKRFFPGGPNKKNAVPNMQIQGTAGAIKNEAILKIHEEIPFYKWSPYSGLILDVHDDVKVVVPESKAEQAIEIINRCFRWSYRGVEFPPDRPKATWDWAGN